MRLTIYILFASILYGVDALQPQSVADSIDQVFDQIPDDTIKVQQLIDLGYEYYNSDPKKTFAYGSQAYATSDRIGYEIGKARGLKIQAIAQWVQGEYMKAIETYDQGLSIATTIPDSIEMSSFIINIGVVYTDMGDYQHALKYYFDALEIIEGSDNLRYLAITYQNMGEIYRLLEEYDNAMDYNTKSLDIFNQIENENGIAVILNNNGEILLSLQHYDSALANLTRSRTMFQKGTNTRGVSIATKNLGLIWMYLKKYNRAEDEFLYSLKLKQEIDDKRGTAEVYGYLGTLKTSVKDYASAEAFFLKGLSIAQSIGAKKEEVDIYLKTSQLMEAKGDLNASYSYFKRYTSLKDSLFNIDKNKQIVLFQTLYDSEKKEKENLMLKKNQELNEQVLAQQRTKSEFYFMLLLVGSVAFMLLGYLFYQKAKSNRQLKELNESIRQQKKEIEIQSEKLTVANEQIKELNSNLESKVRLRTRQLLEYSFKNSHEVRAPLARILGLINLYKNDRNQIDVDDIVTKMERSAIELDDIVREVNNILNKAKKES